MKSELIWRIIGVTAALLTTFSFVPQILKVRKTKSVKDVSFVMLCQFALGVTLWFVYGIYLKDAIIIFANIVTLLSIIILLCFYFKYRQLGGERCQ